MKKRKIFLIVGPLLYVLCVLALPKGIFATMESRSAIGTMVWMALWWLLAPVDYAVTAFLPIAINAIVPMIDMSTLIANYAAETIILLLGASILTASWEITGLDRRIAAAVLKMVGDNIRKQLIFWFLVSAILSAMLPNVVVCATITPIAVAMLKYIGEGDIKESNIGSKILLTIVYAVGVGGLFSPLGGAMNLVTINYIEELTGKEYIYIDWVIKFAPVIIVLVISNILFLLRGVKKDMVLQGASEYFVQEHNKLDKLTCEEVCSLVLFVAATVLSFTRQLYQQFFPGLKPAYIFLICAIISFTISNKEGDRIVVWKNVQHKIVWELIYIFAGGLAVGALINKSGAASDIGKAVANIGISGGIGLIFIIILITILLSDVTSNTATAAVAIPIVISVVNGIGLNPIPYIYVASIGVNLSYMLPTSIRAIPVGYGLSPRYMFKEGYKITIIVLILMTVLSYVLVEKIAYF